MADISSKMYIAGSEGVRESEKKGERGKGKREEREGGRGTEVMK